MDSVCGLGDVSLGMGVSVGYPGQARDRPQVAALRPQLPRAGRIQPRPGRDLTHRREIDGPYFGLLFYVDVKTINWIG